MGHANDHEFHIPLNNIWPPLSCLGAGVMAFGFIVLMHFSSVMGQLMLIGGLFVLAFSVMQWFRGMIAEGRSRKGKVPLVIDLANRYGMIFFIVSEVMFFSAFFAAYFYLSSWNPTWPPENIHAIAIDLPLINTLLLLTSGVTVTLAHHALIASDRENAKWWTAGTWALGVAFLICQWYEYNHAGFGFDGGVYGSLFYMLTGFHGFHVMVGTALLMIAHLRFNQGDFTAKDHFYFEAAAWYWHFVDVVWVGLFLFVYVLS